MLNNPPQPEDDEILDEPDAADVGPTSASDRGALVADAGESAGGKPSAADDGEDSSPLRIKRNRSSSANERDAAGGGDDLPPVAPSVVPCPPVAAPKRRKFGVLLRPRAASAGCV